MARQQRTQVELRRAAVEARLADHTAGTLTALIMAADGDALDAIELFVDDVRSHYEQVRRPLAPEARSIVLARLGNLRAAIDYRRSELARHELVDEARRMVEVSVTHRIKMLRELGNGDEQAQRGNGFAYGFALGLLNGYADALRRFGFDSDADELDQAIVDVEATREGVADAQP